MWAPFRDAPTGANDRPIAGYALGHKPGAPTRGINQGAHKGCPYEGNAGNE